MSTDTGMSRTTGRALSYLEHIRQSIGDILTTPIGSRIERRTYGSDVPDLIDQPLTDALRLRIYAAAVMAIGQWEPRVRVLKIALVPDATRPGRAALDIDLALTSGDRLTLAGILL